jgi:hypothetical protein
MSDRGFWRRGEHPIADAGPRCSESNRNPTAQGTCASPSHAAAVYPWRPRLQVEAAIEEFERATGDLASMSIF